jgi:hypothetical protein
MLPADSMLSIERGDRPGLAFSSAGRIGPA